MTYKFASFELDSGKVELRQDGQPVPIEPQVFELLLLLVRCADRMVSKDEIIENIWNGRIVSEAAVSSRIKSARQVLGDSGKTQSFIKTVHGRGFRFVAPVSTIKTMPEPRTAQVIDPTESLSDAIQETERRTASNRPSIAILPFSTTANASPFDGIATALPHELITELARLRWLFVISRGSTFKLDAHRISPQEVGQKLGVKYCLTGAVQIAGDRMAIMLDLTETSGGGVIWAERFEANVSSVHEVREQIVAKVTSSLEIQITANEAQLARLNASENLDAWSAYHLGLHHMYRFSAVDNAKATNLFERAVDMDPNFARAYAGLSFTRFQDAFLNHTNDHDLAAIDARKFAERSLELDAFDPFCNFTMGRSFWLERNLDQSLSWLDRATQLSPNYAQGIYARAWAETISGRGTTGQDHVDQAIGLSPLDPLLYAMLGTRAFSHIVRGEDQKAAEWAEKAASSPGAHVLISLIAVSAHQLNGDTAKAAKWAAIARKQNVRVNQTDYFKSFPFEAGPHRDRMATALAAHGF